MGKTNRKRHQRANNRRNRKEIMEAADAIFKYFKEAVSYTQSYENMAEAQNAIIQLMEVNRYIAECPTLNISSVPAGSIANLLQETCEVYKLLKPFAKLAEQNEGKQLISI